MAKKLQIKRSTRPLGSTGSKASDGDAVGHVVIVEGIGEVDMPGKTPLQLIRVGGVSYTHVGEDTSGRWTYRPL